MLPASAAEAVLSRAWTEAYVSTRRIIVMVFILETSAGYVRGQGWKIQARAGGLAPSGGAQKVMGTTETGGRGRQKTE